MENLNIEKFSPSVSELQSLVQQSQSLMLTDPTDKGLLKKVTEARIGIKNARVNITKTGKGLREDALAFQRAIITREKQLIAIIEPEENRLEKMEAMAKKFQDREDRREFLPRRHERLNALKDGIGATDDQLLDMDGSAFEGYFNQRSAAKNEKDRLANEELDRKNREIASKLAQETETRVREEKARQEGEEASKREIQEDIDRKERERIDRETRAENQRIAREKDERFQKFLADNGWTADTRLQFKVTDENGQTILWKKIGIFTG